MAPSLYCSLCAFRYSYALSTSSVVMTRTPQWLCMGLAGASGPASWSTSSQWLLGCFNVTSPGFSEILSNANKSVITAIDSCKLRHSMWVADSAIGLTITVPLEWKWASHDPAFSLHALRENLQRRGGGVKLTHSQVAVQFGKELSLCSR